VQNNTNQKPDEATSERLREIVGLASSAAANAQSKLLKETESSPLAFVDSQKFGHFGCDPRNPEKDFSIIEQINQTMTYLVSVRAVLWLQANRIDQTWYFNLGTQGGSDIANKVKDETISCEVFAATNKDSNQKLSRDIAKVRKVKSAEHRFVFCCFKNWDGKIGMTKVFDNKEGKKVTVVQFKREELLALVTLL
jgi:hypothetical protein